MMKRTRLVIFLSAMFMSFSAFAQDNLTLMHYNLLFYGNYEYECNATNNDIADKTEDLRKIVDYTQPDIFTVNELDGAGEEPETEDADYLMNNALNVGGTTHYRKAPFEETFNANTLFYNSSKLTLYAHHSIPLEIGRDKIFNGYTFYYNSAELATSEDTTFFTCFVVHLKAGKGLEEQQQRHQEVQELREYIQQEQPGRGNYLLAGDLNVYRSAEDAYQELVEPSDGLYRFYDPVDQPGDWQDNSDFALYHTQSTHESGDCFSGGGMDDRFDFILLSDDVMEGKAGVSYLKGSYQTIGQDGSSLNKALNVRTNSTVPQDIAEALYGFSDHLPVSLQVRVNSNPAVELFVDTVFVEPDHPAPDDSVEVFAQLTDTEGQVAHVRTLWGESSGQAEGYPRDTSMKLDGNYYQTMLPPHQGGKTVYLSVKGYNSEDEVITSSDEVQYTVDKADVAAPYQEKDAQGFHVVHPVGEQLIIRSDENMEGRYIVEIGDITGNVLIREAVNCAGTDQIKVPAGSLDPGFYWVRIWDGHVWRVEKFIKD